MIRSTISHQTICARKWLAVLFVALVSYNAQPVQADSIVVHAPRGGTYEWGQRTPVAWTATGTSGETSFSLVSVDPPPRTMALMRYSPTERRMAFRIPHGTPPGRYCVQVAQGDVSGRSYVFQVVASHDDQPSVPVDPRPDFAIDEIQLRSADGFPIESSRPATFPLDYDGSQDLHCTASITVRSDRTLVPADFDSNLRLKLSFDFDGRVLDLDDREFPVGEFNREGIATVNIPFVIPTGLRIGQRGRARLRLLHHPQADRQAANNVRNFLVELEGGSPEGMDFRVEISDVRLRCYFIGHWELEFVINVTVDDAPVTQQNVPFRWQLRQRRTYLEGATWELVEGENTGFGTVDEVSGDGWSGPPPIIVKSDFIGLGQWREYRIDVEIDRHGQFRDRNRLNNTATYRFRRSE